MVPFERALVSFYRSSIVTFPLSLCVSEILPLLFSSMPLFPYPTSSLPQISPWSPGSRWITFWLQWAKVLGQLSVQLVSKISNLCDHKSPTSQTDGQTDGRHAIPRSRICTSALRGKNWKGVGCPMGTFQLYIFESVQSSAYKLFFSY